MKGKDMKSKKKTKKTKTKVKKVESSRKIGRTSRHKEVSAERLHLQTQKGLETQREFNKHVGSSIDSFLEEQFLEEQSRAALERLANLTRPNFLADNVQITDFTNEQCGCRPEKGCLDEEQPKQAWYDKFFAIFGFRRKV